MYNHNDKTYVGRPVFISDKVLSRTMDRAAEYCRSHAGHKISVVFHGGEPMLVGPRKFQEMIAIVKESLNECLESLLIQTNGTLVTDEWVEIFKRHNFVVGLSLDGTPDVHNETRVYHSGKGSYNQSINGFVKLQSGGVLSTVLSVISPGHSGAKVYKHFRSLGIEKMDFLIPDVSYDAKPLWYAIYGPTPVADYLIPIFDLWYLEGNPNISIVLLEGVIKSLLGGVPQIDVIGNRGQSYLIVDSDGTIHSSDVLKVCDVGVGESGLNVFEHRLDDFELGFPLYHKIMTGDVELSAKCLDCVECKTCGGGYLPHRYSRSNAFDNPSAWCADLFKLFHHVRSRIGHEIAM